MIHESDYDKENFDVERRGDCLEVMLTYPPRDRDDEGQVRRIYVDQSSVRASDGIRMHYDYDRDGWCIEQASRFAWAIDDEVCDPDWQEVAFIQSWARQETDEEEALRLGMETA